MRLTKQTHILNVIIPLDLHTCESLTHVDTGLQGDFYEYFSHLALLEITRPAGQFYVNV